MTTCDEHTRSNVCAREEEEEDDDTDARRHRASAASFPSSSTLTPRRWMAIGAFTLGVLGAFATRTTSTTTMTNGEVSDSASSRWGDVERRAAPWTTTTTTTRARAVETAYDDADFGAKARTSTRAREATASSQAMSTKMLDANAFDATREYGRGRWINSIEREVARGLGVTPEEKTRGEWIPTKKVIDDVNATATADNEDEEKAWIENYAQLKRRLAREAALEAAGASVSDSPELGFARLGATRDDCPDAYLDGTNSTHLDIPALGDMMPDGFSKYSQHATKIAALADHIYILCIECTTGIPQEWRAKASFVHGFKIDECLKTKGVNHWLKASFSHAHALMDAKKHGYGVVAVVEEDSVTRDVVRPGLTSAQTLWHNMGQIQKVMNQVPNWQTIRVGYRPMFVDRPWESTSKLGQGEKCPLVCSCDKISDFACVMRRAGCDMRSSDFYLVKSTAMDTIIESVYQGKTVDCEAMSRVPNQVFITPQLSYQSHLDLPLEKQIKYSQDFVDVCSIEGELMSD